MVIRSGSNHQHTGGTRGFSFLGSVKTNSGVNLFTYSVSTGGSLARAKVARA